MRKEILVEASRMQSGALDLDGPQPEPGQSSPIPIPILIPQEGSLTGQCRAGVDCSLILCSRLGDDKKSDS